MKEASTKRCLCQGLAAKWVGRLSFSTQRAFNRVGRAMTRPFIEQQHAPNKGNVISKKLRLAMKWWIQALENKVENTKQLSCKRVKIDLFCDAASTPPKLAAVLFDGQSRPEFTRMDVEKRLMHKFEDRKDNQIMGLEILAIILGIETFKEKMRGKLLRIWTDNSGGEHSLRQGSSRTNDYNALVHFFWLYCQKLNIDVDIRRVPTADNIADGPTRPTKAVNCKILHVLDASETEPELPCELSGSDSFKHLLQ